MRLSLVTAPAELPVSLAEAKLHLRVDGTQEDSDVALKLAKACASIESRVGALVTQTWDLILDQFWGSRYGMPKAPLVSVASITYLDSAGASQTWAASNYTVSAPSPGESGPPEPGMINYAYGITTPSTYGVPGAVTVRFVAGYGAASAVPDGIKAEILRELGDLYLNREARIPPVPWFSAFERMSV